MSFTALVTTVNLAARLEPLNKDYGTEILVSEAVRQRVAQRFVFRSVDTLKPRGLETAIQIYELHSEVTHSTAFDAEPAG